MSHTAGGQVEGRVTKEGKGQGEEQGVSFRNVVIGFVRGSAGAGEPFGKSIGSERRRGGGTQITTSGERNSRNLIVDREAFQNI